MEKKFFFNIKRKKEIVDITNMNRTLDRFNFKKDDLKHSNLKNFNKNDSFYLGEELKSIKNHFLVESRQKFLIKDNVNDIYENIDLFSYNTITHNNKGGDMNYTQLWNCDKNKQLYLNNENMKLCGINNKLENRNIPTHERDFLIDYTKELANIEISTLRWFDCMKIMDNDVNKCNKFLFWSKNKYDKLEFYLNKEAIIENIVNIVDIYTTIK